MTVSILFVMEEVSRSTYEEHSHDTTDNGGTSEVPDEVRVSDDGRECEVDNVGEAGVEEVDSGDKTSHVDGSARVSNTVGWDVDEELGESTEGEWKGSPPQ